MNTIDIKTIIPEKYRLNKKVMPQGHGLSIYVPARIAEYYNIKRGDLIDFVPVDEKTIIIKVHEKKGK